MHNFSWCMALVLSEHLQRDTLSQIDFLFLLDTTCRLYEELSMRIYFLLSSRQVTSNLYLVLKILLPVSLCLLSVRSLISHILGSTATSYCALHAMNEIP